MHCHHAGGRTGGECVFFKIVFGELFFEKFLRAHVTLAANPPRAAVHDILRILVGADSVERNARSAMRAFVRLGCGKRRKSQAANRDQRRKASRIRARLH